MRAYIYDTADTSDQREAHDTGINKSVEDLKRIGVLYWRFSGPTALDDLNALAKERDYKNRDQIVVSPEVMGDVYEEKVKMFFAEHLHEDEEIRYVLDGTGFFDVRDQEDVWIRIQVEKDDMLVLPAGIYHRFTSDTKNYIKALRLFKDEPKWVAINRPDADDNSYRSEYLHTIKT
ncbi:Acireductone dioxygenase ARD family [Zychaea mexicana]|uniref:Acireductone dioxygenase ARD family n=1 Tax=Zychaea mexicana TaxID=64656 RepID=UPI0022FE54A9|nr:Acireductone dioxygenase ARD family [Zychaea mexicana]KAI9492818.1 Acireductone dioxygenase ARD family [Zychaea mexicana]